MAITHDQYRQRARKKLGASATDTALFPDTDVTEAINAALGAISAEREWPWLYIEAAGSAVGGSPDYPVPTDLQRVVFLSVNGTPLVPAQAIDLARYRTENGPPFFYTVAGNAFKFSPTPGSGMTYPVVLAYYRTEPLLSGASDTPLIPDAYADWVVAEAGIRLAESTNRLDRLAALKDEAKGWRDRVLDNVRRANAPSRIRRVRDSIWSDV